MFKLVIEDPATLKLWRRQLGSTFWKHKLPVVEIRVAALSEQQNRNFSVLANGLRKTCGCAASGFFMSLSVVTVTIRYFGAGEQLSTVGIVDLLTLLGIVIGAAGAGKMLALLWARWRLLSLAAHIRKHMDKSGRQPAIGIF